MRYLISILGLVAIVGAGYFGVAQYINIAHGQSSLLVAGNGSGAMSTNGAQVLALLNRLQQIKLDGKIFSNPNFLTLQDWSVAIDPQAVGRPNPYLPVYGAAPVVAPSTKVSLPKKKPSRIVNIFA